MHTVLIYHYCWKFLQLIKNIYFSNYCSCIIDVYESHYGCFFNYSQGQLFVLKNIYYITMNIDSERHFQYLGIIHCWEVSTVGSGKITFLIHAVNLVNRLNGLVLCLLLCSALASSDVLYNHWGYLLSDWLNFHATICLWIRKISDKKSWIIWLRPFDRAHFPTLNTASGQW